MDRRVLRGTDLRVSQVCYGTAGMGADATVDEVDELLNAFRDGGGNFIDTAHVYSAWTLRGTGAAERLVGDYVQRNGGEDLVIATKGGQPHLGGYRRTDEWLAPYRIRADIDDSLGRLGLEAIDLYYLHRDDLAMEVAEIIDYLNEEVQRGRIRYLGASNWTCDRIEEANRYAEQNGLRGFAVSQVEWSLAYKESPPPEPRGTQTVYAHEEEVGFHERTGMALVAYTSTARGYFALEEGGRDAYDNDLSRARRQRARELAQELGVTPNQVALAWLMNQDFPVFPITGTLDPEHLRENMAAADIGLDAEQVRWLYSG